MDTIIVFSCFFVSLLFCIYHDISILYPLLFGLAGFTLAAFRRGYGLLPLFGMMRKGASKALIVIRIFVLIGAITAVWRACGTIAFIVYYGTALISVKYFLLSAFLLACLVSFLLGTSFGTVGTIGLVLMVMAKIGQVDGNMAAGAIIAGAYFGDRCSPMSSSANLVAVVTRTKLYTNIKNMLKTSLLPFALSCIAYSVLSLGNPLARYSDQINQDILTLFTLQAVVVFPAAIILVLAACKVDVKWSMSISILSGILISLYVQDLSLLQIARYIATGYSIDSSTAFGTIIQGGGLCSMLNVSLIVLVSSMYAGIFEDTGLLHETEQFFAALSEKINVFPVTILSSIITAAFSCNQTLAILLTHQFTQRIYAKHRLNHYKLALDLENTVILISPLIPWNIAGAVPAAALSADAGFIPYAFYLFLVPLTALLLPGQWQSK